MSGRLRTPLAGRAREQTDADADEHQGQKIAPTQDALAREQAGQQDAKDGDEEAAISPTALCLRSRLQTPKPMDDSMAM